MAGQFVVWKMSPQDKNNFIQNFAGTNWTGLAHGGGTANGHGGVFGGWTPASRTELSQVRNGSSALPNRNNLPPHRYLHIPGGAPTANQITYLQSCYWINDLQRPSDAGFGTVALCQAAATHWSNGRKLDSLVAQITHGATSIEIYYLGSKEMS